MNNPVTNMLLLSLFLRLLPRPEGEYKVTNLGHCGITSPGYPGTNEHKALMAGQWDIIVLMLGTNDAKQGKGNLGYFPNC